MNSSPALDKKKLEHRKQEDTKRPSVLSQFGKIVKIFNTQKKSNLQESIEEIIGKDTDSHEELDAGEKEILKNVLEFKALLVEDVMIPRADIFAIPQDIEFQDLQTKLLNKTYTRIPVYKTDLDEVLGFIHIKDIAKSFLKNEQFEITKFIRKCLFVPSSMKVSNLLIRMQQGRVHIAIVVDEYGGTEGVVTLEDIVEQIVGNIEDEHDNDEANALFKKISDDIYEVSSRITVDEFVSKTKIDLGAKEPDANYDTIGGLVSYILGRIPVKGEVITYNEKIELEVTDADARSVKRLIIKSKG
jgi:CBS domain containing-hemolysin-like protein